MLLLCIFECLNSIASKLKKHTSPGRYFNLCPRQVLNPISGRMFWFKSYWMRYKYLPQRNVSQVRWLFTTPSLLNPHLPGVALKTMHIRNIALGKGSQCNIFSSFQRVLFLTDRPFSSVLVAFPHRQCQKRIHKRSQQSPHRDSETWTGRCELH